MKRCHSSEDEDECPTDESEGVYADDVACLSDEDILGDMEGDPFTSDEDLFPDRCLDAERVMSYLERHYPQLCTPNSSWTTSGPSAQTEAQAPTSSTSTPTTHTTQ